MLESFKKNFTKKDQQITPRKKILGAKGLALIAGLGMLNQGDKIEKQPPNINQARILEIQKEIQNSYQKDDETKTLDEVNYKTKENQETIQKESINTEEILKEITNDSDFIIYEQEGSKKIDNEIPTKTIEQKKDLLNKEKMAQNTEILLNDLIDGLKGENGILASIVRRKIKDHKDDIVKAVDNIDKFKYDNQKYINILDSTYWFSEDPDIRNGQINSLAIVYELYKNGKLEKISNPGLLANLYAKISGETISLYKEIQENVANYRKLPMSEKKEWVEEIAKDTKINVTIDEIEQIIILSNLSWTMEDFIIGMKEYRNLSEKDNMGSKLLKKCLTKNTKIHESITSFLEEITKN